MMGMFDDVRCHYQLPWPEVQDALWQTKSRYCRLDLYEIRADGTLWHEARRHDEDVVIGWERLLLDGELEMFHLVELPAGKTWYEVRFWFRDGTIRDAIYRKGPLVPPGGGGKTKAAKAAGGR